jgi:hypothetical protein
MIIKLPDGTEIPYLRLADARLDHVVKLQRETGWPMAEIVRQASENDAITAALAYWLGMMKAGRKPPKWDDIMSMSLSDFGDVIPEPGDDTDEDDEDHSDGQGKGETTASTDETTTANSASTS